MEQFTLGGWRVDPSQSTLENVKVVKLDFKIMELLCYLVRYKGRVIKRDQLLNALWQEQGANEDKLIMAIGNLRKALGDNLREPIYIKTIPGKGYQLIAPVKFKQPHNKPIDSIWPALLFVIVFGFVIIYFAFMQMQQASQ